ncbi:hypothetical protein BGZ98_005226, partial [Dissophora globulifera]
MAELDEPFSQNDEAAKRFKGGQKRKQPNPGLSNGSANALSPTQAPTQAHNTQTSPSAVTSSTSASVGSNTSRGRSNVGMVYQQPKSLQHHPLPSQPLQLDPSMLTNISNPTTVSNSFTHYRASSTSSTTTNGTINGERDGPFSAE